MRDPETVYQTEIEILKYRVQELEKVLARFVTYDASKDDVGEIYELVQKAIALLKKESQNDKKD